MVLLLGCARPIFDKNKVVTSGPSPQEFTIKIKSWAHSDAELNQFFISKKQHDQQLPNGNNGAGRNNRSQGFYRTCYCSLRRNSGSTIYEETEWKTGGRDDDVSLHFVPISDQMAVVNARVLPPLSPAIKSSFAPDVLSGHVVSSFVRELATRVSRYREEIYPDHLTDKNIRIFVLNFLMFL
ncbi:unnamed protein product [Rhizophagus irregularis]|nr:unnamed protein product [Rhizophagus irregularis]